MRHPQSRGTRCRSPGVSPAAFLAHPLDLQSWPLMDMDFATSCPLVRPVLPRIRFLFVGSRFRSTLPSDSPSRFCPCVSLVLHLHQVAQGTFTPRLLGMPSTQDGRLRRPPLRGAFGILDRSCAPRLPAVVGTKGVPSVSTAPPAGRTKGWSSIRRVARITRVTFLSGRNRDFSTGHRHPTCWAASVATRTNGRSVWRICCAP